MKANFLIYGAYGYTGQLTARFAVERGLKPVLAGRDASKVEALAGSLGLEHLAFDIDDGEAVDLALSGVGAVLHCAGPFAHTYRQMAAGCLRTGSHYLDISGEVAVYAGLLDLDAEARDAGVMLLPGIGFDVVPTDCLAARLKLRMPSADHLALAISSVGASRVSRGTTKTFIEGLGGHSAVRKDGAVTPVPHLSKSRMIGHLIDMSPSGPKDESRNRTRTLVWAEVKDESGTVATCRARLPEAYTFTGG